MNKITAKSAILTSGDRSSRNHFYQYPPPPSHKNKTHCNFQFSDLKPSSRNETNSNFQYSNLK